jgi:hypothetical protein
MTFKWFLDHHERAIILGVALGLLVVSVFDRWPQTDSYTVTLKDRCLTDKGASFTMNYKGWGSVAFHIVPPTPATPEEGNQK